MPGDQKEDLKGREGVRFTWNQRRLIASGGSGEEGSRGQERSQDY